MNMPRNPAVYNGISRHRRIPQAGGAIWYPLLDGLLAPGITDLQPLSEIITSGSAHANKWDTPGMYTLPVANGGTDSVLLTAADDEDDLYNNSQLTLQGMAPGLQIIMACEASYTSGPGGNSALWGFGKQTAAATLLSLQISSAEAPAFHHRAKDAGAAVGDVLNATSGTFTQFKNQGRFAAVFAIKPVSATAVDVELRLGNGTLSAVYTATGIDMTQGTSDVSKLPGVSGGITMANFGGLALGGRNGASAPEASWGRGAGNTGAIGNWQARRYASTDADLCADVLAQLLAHPLDFVLLD